MNDCGTVLAQEEASDDESEPAEGAEGKGESDDAEVAQQEAFDGGGDGLVVDVDDDGAFFWLVHGFSIAR